LSTDTETGFVIEGSAVGLSGVVLRELLGAVLDKGVPFRFEARGTSMHPFIRDRDVVTVAPLPQRSLVANKVVAFRHPESGVLVLHRIREVRPEGLLVQGDNVPEPDAVVRPLDLVGLVTRAERAGVEVYLGDEPPGVGAALAWAARVSLGRLVAGARAATAAESAPASKPAPAYTTRQQLFESSLFRGQAPKRIPRQFDLEITARCNCDCRHCYLNLPAADRAARASELSLAEIERIAGEAVELGALWCLLTGGEPLLREDFSEIYLALKRKGLLVSVFTNATLITPAHVELLRTYPPRDVEVTVYGATKDTYERVTRKVGSFDAFQRGLGRLLDGGIKVRLKAVALRSNAHELAEIARFCRERTKDYFRFDPLLTLRLDGDPGRNQDIRNERLSAAEIVALEHADDERHSALLKDCDRLTGSEESQDDRLLLCGAGNAGFSVGADGSFRLCSSLCHPDTISDLRKVSVRHAWQQLVPRVRDIRSQRPEFLDNCRRCPLVNLCSWCPAHAHLEDGEMDSRPEYFCQVAHERARAIKP